jgi:hypothetical protein
MVERALARVLSNERDLAAAEPLVACAPAAFEIFGMSAVAIAFYMTLLSIAAAHYFPPLVTKSANYQKAKPRLLLHRNN